MIVERATALSLVAVAISSIACAPPKYYAAHTCDRPDLAGCVIDKVSVVGAKKVPASDIEEKIATAETSHGIFGALGAIENVPILSIADRLTVDYERLDPFVLERDLVRVERLYRARGYYEAHARAARVRRSGNRAHVEIVVEEGEPVTVGSVLIEGKDGKQIPAKLGNPMRRAVRPLGKGVPFAEASFEEVKKRAARAMTDNGYAYATVDAKATVDLVAHRADIVINADPGPPTTFGRISIEGAGDLPTSRLMQAIAINEGEPYSTAKLESAQIALGDLRVLGSIDAVPDLGKDGARPSAVPVVFRVTPTSLKTVKMGFGFEIGSRVDVHGLASWENRNFLGGLRALTLEGKPGIVFPYTLTSLFNTTPSALAVVPEMRLHAALIQPGFIEARTRGLLSADVNLYQLPLQPTDTLGYLEFASKLGIERDFWDHRIHVGAYANVQVDQPFQLKNFAFDLVGCAGAGGYTFRALPFAQSTFALDLRRGAGGKPDPINPHSGFYLGSDVQFAVAGSQDVRLRSEMRGYLPVTKRVTLAMRATVGGLYAFGGDLSVTPTPDPIGGCPKNQDKSIVYRSQWIQVLQLRGFSSGGTNSNRGYGYGGVGPQEVVPGVSQRNANNELMPVSTGGKAMWEASVELRVPVYGGLGIAIFVDGSDVRQSFTDLGAPFAPHLSTGLGVRYATPIGPLRLDLGLRVPGLQVIGSGTNCRVYDPSLTGGVPCVFGKKSAEGAAVLSPEYGQAASIQGVPLAITLAVGEAF